jgi:hypothetical protein
MTITGLGSGIKCGLRNPIEEKKERANFEISCLGVPDAVARAIIGSARCRALSIQEQ